MIQSSNIRMNKTFKEIVDELMSQKRFTSKAKLAEALGMSAQDMNRYYNGGQCPSFNRVVEMMDQIGSTVAVFHKAE